MDKSFREQSRLMQNSSELVELLDLKKKKKLQSVCRNKALLVLVRAGLG